MKRCHGFTLLEICLAVAICLLLVLIAVPSVKGVIEEQRLRRTFDDFDLLVRKAQARSVDQRRSYVIAWTKEGIDLYPFDLKEDEPAPQPEHLSVGKNEEYTLERVSALSKDAPPVWPFWRSGTCEPVIVRYEGPNGKWTVRYDALTAHGTFLSEEVR